MIVNYASSLGLGYGLREVNYDCKGKPIEAYLYDRSMFIVQATG